MNAENLNKWLSLAANLGVVAGLVFLAIEINQNTKATIAAASEEVTNQSLDYFALGMDNEVISRALYKLSAEQELDGFERDQLRSHQYYNFRVFQNVYMQYRRGFLEQSEWDTYSVVLRSRLERDPFARQMWIETSGAWNSGFEDEVNRILSNSDGDFVVGF